MEVILPLQVRELLQYFGDGMTCRLNVGEQPNWTQVMLSTVMSPMGSVTLLTGQEKYQVEPENGSLDYRILATRQLYLTIYTTNKGDKPASITIHLC